MAHHKSAKKRIRSNERKRARTSSYVSSVRSAVKAFRAAAAKNQDLETLKPLFLKAQKKLATAAAKGRIHKNTASRRTSRLAQLLAKKAG